jgi:hypothetical protein
MSQSARATSVKQRCRRVCGVNPVAAAHFAFAPTILDDAHIDTGVAGFERTATGTAARVPGSRFAAAPDSGQTVHHLLRNTAGLVTCGFSWFPPGRGSCAGTDRRRRFRADRVFPGEVRHRNSWPASDGCESVRSRPRREPGTMNVRAFPGSRWLHQVRRYALTVSCLTCCGSSPAALRNRRYRSRLLP